MAEKKFIKKDVLASISYAAEWWTDILFDDKKVDIDFGIFAKQEEKIKDIEENVKRNFERQKIVRKMQDVDGTKREAFKIALEEEFAKAYDAKEKVLSVGGENEPDELLKAAAQTAGFKLEMFDVPPLVEMELGQDGVEVSMCSPYFDKIFDPKKGVIAKTNFILDEDLIPKSETAKFAAQWWADLAFGDMETKVSIGATKKIEKQAETFLEIMHQMERKKQKRNPEKEMQKEAFRSALETCIEGELACGYTVHVYTDYEPQELLQTAIEKSGVNFGRCTFPPKTCMTVTANTVEVSMGYGAKREKIFDARENTTTENKVVADAPTAK